MKILIFVFLVGIVGMYAGCKKAETSPICTLSGRACSCDIPLQATVACYDYHNITLSSASSHCAGITGGSLRDGTACSTTGVVGTCVTTLSDQQKYHRYYNNASSGATDCGIIGGVWQ